MKSWEQNWECVECRSIFAKPGNVKNVMVTSSDGKLKKKTYFTASKFIKLISFHNAGKYSKQKKRSLATSEKTDGTTCLLEEPSPKYPRQSPGSQHSFLQCVIL